MKFGSLFSGIGGFDLGFERADMQCAWQCEIDKAAQEVLKKHFNVEIFDDVTTIGNHNLQPVDLLCGGFPCQDVSIAGKRAGLAGKRSGLWTEFARIIDELEPKWVVIENVPGLLSSNKGEDFAVILRWLVERGYGVSWRILDSQYFGVAQRRRRVFIVASFGNGKSAQVLFESEGVCWNPPPRGKAGERTANTFTIRSGKEGGGKGYLGQASLPMTLGGQKQYVEPTAYSVREDAIADNFSANEIDVANAVNSLQPSPQSHHAQTFIAYNIHQVDDARKDRPNGGMYIEETDNSLTLQTGQGKSQTVIAYENHPNDSRITETGDISKQLTSRMGTGGGNVPLVQLTDTFRMTAFGGYADDDSSSALKSRDFKDATDLVVLNDQGGSQMSITTEATATLRSQEHGHQPTILASGVRRLTPTECARLQGFPDDWNDWQSDTSRYKQYGNAVTVNVAEWIGKRIVEVDKNLSQ